MGSGWSRDSRLAAHVLFHDTNEREPENGDTASVLSARFQGLGRLRWSRSSGGEGSVSERRHVSTGVSIRCGKGEYGGAERGGRGETGRGGLSLVWPRPFPRRLVGGAGGGEGRRVW